MLVQNFEKSHEFYRRKFSMAELVKLPWRMGRCESTEIEGFHSTSRFFENSKFVYEKIISLKKCQSGTQRTVQMMFHWRKAFGLVLTLSHN